MTRSQAFAALRRGLLPALLAAAVALGVVLALLLTASPSYQARVGIAAVPLPSTNAANPEYGSVVSLAMPALPEIALSSPVVEQVSARVPGMNRETLEKSVAVELVPASGVARVTVTADSPQAATTVLSIVTDTILRSDIVEPVAKLQVLGDVDAQPVQQRPDSPLAIGLAVLAAAVAGLLAVAAVQILSPRLLTVTDVEQAVKSVTPDDVPVVPVSKEPHTLDVLLSQLRSADQSAATVHGYPAGPRAADEQLVQVAESALQHDAAGSPRRAAGDACSALALVLVRLRRSSRAELVSALLKAREAHSAVVVAVSTSAVAPPLPAADWAVP